MSRIIGEFAYVKVLGVEYESRADRPRRSRSWRKGADGVRDDDIRGCGAYVPFECARAPLERLLGEPATSQSSVAQSSGDMAADTVGRPNDSAASCVHVLEQPVPSRGQLGVASAKVSARVDRDDAHFMAGGGESVRLLHESRIVAQMVCGDEAEAHRRLLSRGTSRRRSRSFESAEIPGATSHCSFGDRAFQDIRDFTNHSFRVKMVDDKLSHPRAKRRLPGAPVGELPKPCRERVRVPGRNDEPRGLAQQHLGDPSDGRPDPRGPACHRLGKRSSESLRFSARQDAYVRSVVQVHGIRPRSEPANVMCYPQRNCERMERGKIALPFDGTAVYKRPSRDEKTCGRNGRLQLGEGPQQALEILASIDATHVQHCVVSSGEIQSASQRASVRERSKTPNVDAVHDEINRPNVESAINVCAARRVRNSDEPGYSAQSNPPLPTKFTGRK
jgi:hypothetical protein